MGIYKKLLKSKNKNNIMKIISKKEWKGRELEFFEIIIIASTLNVGDQKQIKDFINKKSVFLRKNEYREYYETFILIYDKIRNNHDLPNIFDLSTKWKTTIGYHGVSDILFKEKNGGSLYSVITNKMYDIDKIKCGYINILPLLKKSMTKLSKDIFNEIDNKNKDFNRLVDITKLTEINKTEEGFDIFINYNMLYSSIVMFVYYDDGNNKKIFDINTNFSKYLKGILIIDKLKKELKHGDI